MSLDETWKRLSNNIREIFAQNAANLSFEENHRFSYNLVLGKQSEKLYEGVKVLIVENLQKMVKDKLIPAFPTGVRSDMISRAKEGEELLKAFRCVWDDHESGLCKLRDILKYLVCPSSQVRVWLRRLSALGPSVCTSTTPSHHIRRRGPVVPQAHNRTSDRGSPRRRCFGRNTCGTRRVRDQPVRRSGMRRGFVFIAGGSAVTISLPRQTGTTFA